MNFSSDDLLELTNYLDENNISRKYVCIVGSSTLSLIGIRKHNDIDIVLHSKFDLKLPKHQFIERINKPWSTLFSDDELVENSDLHIIFKGFKFVIPELIFHRKIWQNRIKDKQDILELHEYAKMHKDWRWGLIENSLPKKSLLKVFVNRAIQKIRFYIKKLSDYFYKNNIIHSDCLQVIATNILFSKQFVNNRYNRIDLIVRYKAIQSYLNNDDTGIKIYKKMQQIRGNSEYKFPWQNFKVLIDNYKNVGYSLDSPITVNNELQIVDGAHRLACALYFQSPLVSVKIDNKFNYSAYGENWFKEADFNSNQILSFSKNRKELFIKNFLYFEVILWPPVARYFDDITSEINNQYSILESRTYSHIKNLNSHIRNIYKIDDIKRWKIDKKIEAISAYSKELRVLKIEIPNPDFREKSNGKLISRKVERLKQKIRKKYSSEIQSYFHDIIIHIGDNYEHSKHSSKLEIEI